MPYPFAIPSPRTWSNGMGVKAPYLRTDVGTTVAIAGTPAMFSGSQITTGESIGTSTPTQVILDTEQYDNLGGHTSNILPWNYYGMFPGWYLCISATQIAYSGGVGGISAGIGASFAGGTLVYYWGQRLPNSATASQFSFPVAAKLIQMTNVGTLGGATNDYVCAMAIQDTGATQNLTSATHRWPYLQCWWVASPTSVGTGGLAVPTNDAWPLPPSIVTAAFLNKNIRDTANFVLYPPICEAYYLAGTATLASQSSFPATGTTIPLDTATVDNYSAFSTSTHTWTAPVAGVYWVWVQCALTMSTTSLALAAGLTVSSANYNAGTAFTMWGSGQQPNAVTGGFNAAVFRRKLRLNAGDTLKPAGWQHDSGTATATFLNSNGNDQGYVSRMITCWRAA